MNVKNICGKEIKDLIKDAPEGYYYSIGDYGEAVLNKIIYCITCRKLLNGPSYRTSEVIRSRDGKIWYCEKCYKEYVE